MRLIIVLALSLLSCSKAKDLPIEAGKIEMTKYPCGSNCTATTWLIELNTGEVYEPTNLPESYQKHNLAVKVQINRIGLRSVRFEGQGEELAEIVSISK